MTQGVAIHKGKEQFPNWLWWEPFFAWQKQMNRMMQGFFPFVTAPAFWKTGEEIFDSVQQSANRMVTPWWTGNDVASLFDTLHDKNLLAQAVKTAAMTGATAKTRKPEIAVNGKKAA